MFFGLEFSSLASLGEFIGSVVLLVCVGLALYGGLFGALFGAVGGRWGSPFLWAGAWALVEALRAAGPLGFTFGSLPTALVGSPFLPAAAIGGPWILSLALAWTAGCLARAVRERRWLIGAALGPLALFGLAALPTGTRETGSFGWPSSNPTFPRPTSSTRGSLRTTSRSTGSSWMGSIPARLGRPPRERPSLAP